PSVFFNLSQVACVFKRVPDEKTGRETCQERHDSRATDLWGENKCTAFPVYRSGVKQYVSRCVDTFSFVLFPCFVGFFLCAFSVCFVSVPCLCALYCA